MDVEVEDASLRRLEQDASYSGGYDPGVVKAFRKRMQLVRAAIDERAFIPMKSLHYEKLKGDLEGYNSMRLNDQWRLLLKLVRKPDGKLAVIVAIVDYH